MDMPETIEPEINSDDIKNELEKEKKKYYGI